MGQGKQIKIVKGTPLPRNWKFSLHVDNNKRDLVHLLVQELVTEKGFKELVINRDKMALSNSSELNKTQLTPCTHEEAHTINNLASQGRDVIKVVTSRYECCRHSHFLL